MKTDEMTDDELRAAFSAECERLEDAVRMAMRPPDMASMSTHDLVVHHRAAVLALTAILGDLFLMIPDPDTREAVRVGALECLAPLPDVKQELH